MKWLVRYRALIVSVLSGIGLVFLVNTLIPEPFFDTNEEWLEFAETANRPDIAHEVYASLRNENPKSVQFHYGYISTHFRKWNSQEDDQRILSEYRNLSMKPDPELRDIGRYGMGLCFSNNQQYDKALFHYEQIENQDMPYLNNSMGYSYRRERKFKLAEQHFKKEIELNGNINGAYFNLGRLYYYRGNKEKFEGLMKSDEARPHVELYLQRQHYFKKGNIIMYYYIHLKKIWLQLNLLGYLAALLIMGSWMMYLRKLDVFEVESWAYILLALALGMIFSHGTMLLSDFNKEVLGFSLNGELWNDFFYCVLGIGAIEELMKIIPVLLILRFTDEINEPYDYILYASLSALGFAFIENLIYISESQLHIINGRGLAAAVGHMFFTSIVAYGMILNKYKREYNAFVNFAFFFALASIAHGFWDFWLINETASQFSFLTFVLLLSGIFIWNSFKNNALNHSTFFDKSKVHNADKLSSYLVYSLSAIVLFEYLAVSIKYGPNDGNEAFRNALQRGSFLILFLSSNLGQFRPKRGKWVSIRYWGKNKSLKIPDLQGRRIVLESFSKHFLTAKYFPNEGVITKERIISNESEWYLVKLDKAALAEGYNSDYIFVKPKLKSTHLGPKKILIATYVIPEGIDPINAEGLSRKDFLFIHWSLAKLEPITVKPE